MAFQSLNLQVTYLWLQGDLIVAECSKRETHYEVNVLLG